MQQVTPRGYKYYDTDGDDWGVSEGNPIGDNFVLLDQEITTLEQDLANLGLNDLADVNLAGAVAGDLLYFDGLLWKPLAAAMSYVIPISIGNGINVIAPGIWTDVEISIPGNISEIVLLSTIGGAGDLVLDLWRCSYAQFDGGATHPVVGDSITAAAKPTLAAQTKNRNAVLTGWSKALALNDVLRIVVDSAASIRLAYFGIKVVRS